MTGSSCTINNKEHVLSVPRVQGPILRALCASIHGVLIPAPQGGCYYPKVHAEGSDGVTPPCPLLFLPSFLETPSFLRAFPAGFGPRGPRGMPLSLNM